MNTTTARKAFDFITQPVRLEYGHRLARRGRSVAVCTLVAAILAFSVEASAETWTKLVQKDGITVDKMTDAGGDWVRVRGDLKLNCAQINRTLSAVETYDAWMDIDDWRVLEKSASRPLMYGAHDLPFPFDDRDYVVRYEVKASPNLLTVTARSTTTQKRTPHKGVRLTTVYSQWRTQQNGERCAVTYKEHSDLGGAFPSFLLDSAWESQGPDMMAALQKHSAQHVQPAPATPKTPPAATAPVDSGARSAPPTGETTTP